MRRCLYVPEDGAQGLDAAFSWSESTGVGNNWQRAIPLPGLAMTEEGSHGKYLKTVKCRPALPAVLP